VQCEGIRTMNDTDVARKKVWVDARKIFHNAKLFFAAHNVSHAPAASQIALNSGSHFNVIRLVCHNREKNFRGQLQLPRSFQRQATCAPIWCITDGASLSIVWLALSQRQTPPFYSSTYNHAEPMQWRLCLRVGLPLGCFEPVSPSSDESSNTGLRHARSRP
jgi:hypothetical protein